MISLRCSCDSPKIHVYYQIESSITFHLRFLKSFCEHNIKVVNIYEMALTCLYSGTVVGKSALIAQVKISGNKMFTPPMKKQ